MANHAAVIGNPTVSTRKEDSGVDASGNLKATGTISITDADAGQASFQTTVIAAAGTLGTLTLAANGSYTYTVANSAVQYLGASDTKVETFTITSFDGTTKNVSFTISGTNDAAVIGTLAASLTEDTNVVGNNLTASGSISVSDVDQNQSSFQTTVTAAAGTLGSLVLASDGTYSYSVANAAVQYLAAGATKVETFTLKSLDGTSRTVSFTINGQDDAAVIGNPTVTDVTEDTNVGTNGKLSITGSISVSDADLNQSSFKTTVTAAAGTLGTLSLAANGTYTYSVTNSAVGYLTSADTKVETFTIKTTGGTTKDITFTIHGSDDAAVIGTPTVASVKEDTAVDGSGNLKASGTISVVDQDAGQSSFQTTVAADPGTLGNLVLGTNGSYTYTVSNSAVQYLGVNDSKTDVFTVTSFDGTTKSVSFIIKGTNDAAVIGTPSVASVVEDVDGGSGALTAVGTIAISDVDQNQASFQTTVTAAAGVLGSLVLAADGSYTYTVANSAVQYLGAGDTKVETFTLKALDGTSKNVSFTINGQDDAAVIGSPAVTDVIEDNNVGTNGKLTATGSISISDVDQGEASFKTTVVSTAGNLGTLTMTAAGTYTYSVSNSAIGYLQSGDTKVETFTIQSSGGTTKELVFTIHGASDAAVIGNPTVVSVKEDTTVDSSGNLKAAGTISIIDTDAGQASFQTTVTAAAGVLGNLVLATNGSYTYTVANSAVQYLGAGETKAEVFTVTSFDGTTKNVTFTITGLNDAAVIGTATVTAVTEDTSVNGGNLQASGSISISDADQNQAAFQTTVTAAAGVLGSLNLAPDGTYTYSVANSAVQYLGAGDTKIETFTIKALDGTSKTVSFTINGQDDAAIIGTPAVADVTEDTAVGTNGKLTATGSISISDADAGESTFKTTVVSAAGNLGSLVIASNGTYTYSVTNSAVGYLVSGDSKVETFTIQSSGGTTKDVSFTIHGTDDVAVIGNPTAASVKEDTAVDGSGNLKATGSISIVDGDAGQAVFQTTVSPAAGTLGSLVLASNGSYTYTVANSAVQYLGAAETKIETFTISSFDGTTKNISFTITGVNDAAVIGTATVVSVTEDVNVTGDNLTAAGSISVSDVDQNQAAFQTTVTAAAGVLGSLVLATDGSYTYSVANSAVQYLGTGDTKVDTFTLKALDGTSKNVSFTIVGQNDAAVIGTPTVADVTEDANVSNGKLTATGSISVSDADTGESTFKTTVTSTAGNLGSLVLAANGTYTYSVTNSAVQYLNSGDTKVDSFTIKSFDGTATTIAFTIHGENEGGPIIGDANANTLIGTSGNDTIQGLGGNDFLQGKGGNDSLDGGTGFDTASYADATGGVTINLAAGTASGAGVGSDTFVSVEGFIGSAFADTYDATGYNPNTTPVPGMLRINNVFEGGGGNDTITGNFVSTGPSYGTAASYKGALDGVTVDLGAGTAQGTAAGDVAGVGTDTLSGVATVIGSNFADVLTGGSVAQVEQFEGRGGADFIDGKAGLDTAIYQNESQAISVNLAAGTVTGGDGNDTLRSVEQIRGTNFADTFNAVGFGSASTNAGSSGTFNEFEGLGGNDSVTGNGNTRISYQNAAAAVTVDLAAGTGQGTAAGDAANVGVDTFTGVTQIRGSAFNDTLLGANTSDTFDGRAGDDLFDGRGGFDFAAYNTNPNSVSGISVDMAAGTVTGDAFNGNDTLRSIEQVNGTNFADTYTAVGFGQAGALNVGSNGTFNAFQGFGGDDTITGNGSTQVAYFNANAGVIADIQAGTGHGIAAGDAAGVGNDTLVSGIVGLGGSGFDDTLLGSNNAAFTTETFEGRAGNDTIDGRGGFDQAVYGNDLNVNSGINVNLAAGTVTGPAAIGTDTLLSVESIRGTNFADTFNATGFGSGSTNAGSLGTFNEFEGLGGNDTIIGNGDTRISFVSSSAGVTVDLAAGTASGAAIGNDTFTGVSRVRGSNANDIISGDGNNNILEGQGGIDTVSYASATSGVTVNLSIGIAQNTVGAGSDTLTGFENLTGSSKADTLTGNAGANVITGGDGDDLLSGGGGNDTLIGGLGRDFASYGDATGGITVDLAAGTVSGAGIGTDTLQGVEGVIGSNYADTFVATNFSSTSTNAASNDVVPLTASINSFEGGAGDDTIVGNGQTLATYINATGSVTVDLLAGTADGDSSVGHDTLTGVNQARGSAFNDTLLGSNSTTVTEAFVGGKGDDFIDGRGGFDRVNAEALTFNDVTAGVQVNMAAGTLDGDASVGHDTMRSIEAVRGTSFADTYDATGFGLAGAANVGNNGTFNSFEGMGGNDTIIGNGNTQLTFYVWNTAPDGTGVTVDIQAGTVDGDSSVGHDTFSGVNSVNGSFRGDILLGSNNANGTSETFNGEGGDDFIDGRGGFDTADFSNVQGAVAGVAVNMAAGIAIGDVAVGTDTLRSIESIRGTNFADTYDATGYGQAGALNVGNNGTFNAFQGFGGNDAITGNGNTQIQFGGATAGVTVDLVAGTANGDASVGSDTFTGVNSVVGSNFDDTILGDNNNNGLSGQAGNDTLNGRGGNDSLTGGLGSDTFIYAIGDGFDTITDFNHGQGDKIDLTGVANIYSLADLQAVSVQSGANTVINFGGGSGLTLLNTTLTNLVSADFVFAAAPNRAPTDIVLSNNVVIENTSNGSVIGTLSATDPDANETFAYSLPSDAGGRFAIVDGNLVVNGTVDYEAAHSYDITVRVMDSANNSFDKNFTINVTDQNDVAATITSGAAASASESTSTSTVVYSATSTDPDTVGTASYLLSGADADQFNIDTVTGEITFVSAPDHEAPADADGDNVYNLVVHVDDGVHDTSKAITITVTDQNDVAPVITSAVTANSDENTPAATPVYVVSASDPDTVGSITYSITGADAGQFDIDANTGVVTFKVSPDFEAPTDANADNTYDVIVHANDGVHDSTQAVTISVNDVSESSTIIGDANPNTLIGTSGNDTIQGLGGNDFLQGKAGNDSLDGGAGFDTASYADATGGVTINLVAGTASGAGVGSDTFASVEGFIGSAFADTYDATGYNPNTTPVPGMLRINNIFEGGGGNDTITGNFNSFTGGSGTGTSYEHALDGVTVDLGAGTGHGTAAGDVAGVGSDTFSGVVNTVIGSSFADVLNGGSISQIEQFEGRGGADFIDGKGGLDTAIYQSESQAISVNLAAGTVIGGDGNDTLRSVEQIRGTAFADTFNSVGFGSGSTNAGSNGTFNEFEGLGGNDSATGNGNTRISYQNAAAAVTVDIQAGTGQGTAAGDVANVGVDTFTGVNQVRGSAYDDTILGSSGNDSLDGRAGDDFMDGRAGFDTVTYNTNPNLLSGVSIDMAAGAVTGDAFNGTDTLRSIEQINGSNFADTYTAVGFGQAGALNVGNNGTFNAFQGFGGNDTITGNGNTQAGYFNALAAVTVDLQAGTGQGTAAGDIAAVGIDSIGAGVNGIAGSSFNDTLLGSNNAALTSETFEGRAGNDFIDGRGGFDQAVYGNDGSVTGGINVNLAAGTVTGPAAIGTDTLQGIESIRGTNFNDTFNAVGFGSGSTNAGSLGTLNEFEGLGGNDTITGNGDTRITFVNSSAGVTVDLAAGTASGAAIGSDTFTGVARVRGSNANDTISGDANNNILEGQNGNDIINGRGGNDTITGGTGSDTIAYSVNGGADVVMDFTQAQGDKIDLTAFSPSATGIYSLADVVAISSQVGANTVINFGSGNTLTLNGVTLANLTANDFLFGTPAAIVGTAGNDTLIGTSVNDTMQGLDGNDTLQGRAGNDSLDGGNGFDTASYADATGGVTINLNAGTASGAGIGNDTLAFIEGFVGSASADTFDATGYNPTVAPVPGMLRIYNVFEGGGGDDTIIGNFNTTTGGSGTAASYEHALDGVTVDLGAGTGRGTAAGDVAGVGNDTFSGVVNTVIGSSFADVLTGGSVSQVEQFEGRGGADFIDGKGGFDTAIYQNESQAIVVSLAAGTVTGGDGNDTLRSVEQIRGTAFNDTFNANGFNGVSTNAGSSGTFNEFEGMGGNDTVTGNGNTRISYQNALAAVTVDLVAGTGQGTAAGDVAGVGVDTFTGTNLITQIRGSAFDDTLLGSNINDTLDGRAGNDMLDGRNGFDTVAYNSNPNALSGIAVDMAAGTVTGDAFTGTDTLRSIEQVNGSLFADTYTAVGFGQAGALNVGNNGTFNAFQGFGGNDTITGNGNTQVAYFNASAAVTVDLQAGTAQGTAAGDLAAVGIDSIGAGVSGIGGSSFNDTLLGSNNAALTTETFEGRAGNDFINGRGGFDQAVYGNDGSVTGGINVNLAAGTVTGPAAIGTDTLQSIESIRGTNFADTFNAVGFSGSSTNAGSSGTINEFEGLGGNDTITGNGDTRVTFTNSSAGVTVDLAAGTASGAAIGSDTFTGVARVRGSNANDTISGDGNNNVLEGQGGNDTINGRGGNDTITGGAGNDTFVFTGLNGAANTNASGTNFDVVTDYTAGTDHFDLTGLGLGSGQYATLESMMTEAAGNVTITVDAANTLTINATTIAVLHSHQSDFLL